MQDRPAYNSSGYMQDRPASYHLGYTQNSNLMNLKPNPYLNP